MDWQNLAMFLPLFLSHLMLAYTAIATSANLFQIWHYYNAQRTSRQQAWLLGLKTG